MNLEQVASNYLKSYVRETKAEIIPVICTVGRQAQIAHADDVHAFLKTLDTDQSIRFDVSDAEAPEGLIHAKPEEPEVDIDLDKSESKPVILARKRKHHFVYFAGFFKHRPLWTTDARCAQVFASDEEVIRHAFQFGDDGDIVQEVFMGLGLQLLTAPKTE